MSDTQVLDTPTIDPGILDALEPDGYQDIDVLSHDWSFLNTEPVDDDFDSNATLEEEMARRAAKEAEQNTPETPVAEPEAKKVDDKATEVPTDEVKGKVEFADKVIESLNKHPEAVAQMAINAMTAAQKTALLKSLGFDPAAATANKAPVLPDIPEDYEPIGELETAIAARWNDIKSVSDMRRELDELKASQGNGVEEARNLREPIGYAMTRAEIAEARLDAICEVLGIEIASPDLNAVAERLKDGRTTHRSAVRALTQEPYKKAMAEYKQGRAARPQTPGNNSTHAPKIKEGASMVEIARALSLLG